MNNVIGDIIADTPASDGTDADVSAEDISHLRNYLFSSHSGESGALSSLSSLACTLGITEAELAEMCLNASKPKR